MKLNNLSLLFLKLYLKNNNILFNKMNLNSKLCIKSFYKNDYSSISNLLVKINNNILKSFIDNLYNYYFLIKLLNYNLIKNSLKNRKLFKKSIFNHFSIYSYKPECLFFKEIITFKLHNSFSFSKFLHNFYFIYFLFFFLVKLFTNNFVKISKLPNNISKITLLRSPHIDKKSREQFEILTHKTNLNVINLFNTNFINIIKKINNNSYIEISI